MAEVFEADGHGVRRLNPEWDESAVARLFQRCSDYTLMVTGEPPQPTAARDFFGDKPESKTLDEAFKFGIASPGGGQLVGLLEAVRGYPQEDTWYVGLLLLDPECRGRGLGRSIYDAFEQWVASQGAKTILLSVLEENRRGLRFWRLVGFEVVRKLPPRRFGAKEHVRFDLRRTVGAPVHKRDGWERYLDGAGRVTAYPAKAEPKRRVLEYLASKFQPDREYSEREVNEILKAHHTFGDWALLRRDMFEAGLLGRDRNGARYRRR